MESSAQLAEKSPTSPSSHDIAPGPRQSLLPFLLFGTQRDLLGLYLDAFQKHGDVVRFQVGPRFLGFSAHFFNHPDQVKYVLQDNAQNYRRSIYFEFIKPLVGEGLLTSEGDFWRRQRRLTQPAFHRQRIQTFAEQITGLTGRMLERWGEYSVSGKPLDVSAEMMRLTLGIVSQALFSTDVSGEAKDVGQAMAIALEQINHRSRHPLALPAWVPTPRNRRFARAIQTLDAIVFKIIEERRQEETDQTNSGDLLSMLLRARDEETGEGMTDQQLRDEVMTFVLAGHETTAITLTWAWYLLSKHPHVEHHLRAELDEVLAGRTPTFDDLPQLIYTRMVVEEVLRLYPPAWSISRNTIGEDEVCGYHIPANSVVSLCSYTIHRHPEFWDNPEGFDPERFTPENVAERPRYAYFPFGGGQRQCIGNEFALMEAQLVLAQVAQQCRLHLIPGLSVRPDPIFTLRPNRAVWMTLHERVA